MNSDDLPPIKDHLIQHDVWAKKSFGQNFLFDLNITRKIARLANARPGVQFVEIGPGPGGLTRALLLEGVEQLTVIEHDRRMAPILTEISKCHSHQLNVLFKDALQIDWDDFSAEPFEIIGNLPYNIGTQLLINWLTLQWPPKFSRLTLMFQEEVAERIVAQPGSKLYGRISVLAKWRAHVEIIYRLPNHVFTPPPKVSSALVCITPKPTLEFNANIDTFSQLTGAAFGQRRKMLRQSLKSIHGDIIPILDELGIDATARAENLNWSDYCRLALALDAQN